MDRNPSQSTVNLPRRTRSDLVGAARAGARDAVDLEEHFKSKRDREARESLGRPVPPLPSPDERHVVRDRDGTKTIEISVKEHQLLVEIAALTEIFFPLLELSAAPVSRPTEWNMLRDRLLRFRQLLSGNNMTAANTDAILGLLEAQRLLAD